MTPEANTSQKRKRTPTKDKASKKQRKRKTTALKTTAPSSPDTQSHATTPPRTPTAPPSFSLETLSTKDQAAHTRLQQQIHAETEILHVYLRSLRNQLTQTPSRDAQYEICKANAKGIAAQYAILGDLERELKYFGRSVELHTLDEAAAIKKEKTGELLNSSIPSWAEVVAAWGQPVVDRVRRDTHSGHFCTYLGWFARRGFVWTTVANLLATAVVNRLDDSRRPSRLALLTVDAVHAKKEIPRPAPVLAAKDVLRVGCRLDRFGLLVPMSVEEREWARFL